jgi:LmbE family N-acetylglucosaminyl deacetylase
MQNLTDSFKVLIDNQKIMVVAAHPDDETIAVGGLLQTVPELILIHLTKGVPRDLSYAINADCMSRESYADMRLSELWNAMKFGNIKIGLYANFNLTDQETSFNMAGIAFRLAKFIRDNKPALLFTHAYEGGHPDHDTASFATRAALKMLLNENSPIPKLYEFPIYNNHNDQSLYNTFIPYKEEMGVEIALDEEKIAKKKKMLKQFISQKKIISKMSINTERFRLAPQYDFTIKPHNGILFYEVFNWGITWKYWQFLADEAGKVMESD